MYPISTDTQERIPLEIRQLKRELLARELANCSPGSRRFIVSLTTPFGDRIKYSRIAYNEAEARAFGDAWFRRLSASRGGTALATGSRVTTAQGKVNFAARTVELSYSSETPVPRDFGNEILSHKPGAVDQSRLNSGAPLLFNHKMDDVIGVVESARIGSDRRGYATVRFAKTARGNEIMDMVQDGILRNVSFMYRINAVEDNGSDDFLVTSHTPLEISIVTVPADNSVGVGRGPA